MSDLARLPGDTHLTLALTHACNMRCRYCYAGPKHERHMSPETALAALRLAASRTGRRLHLVFFGGEPLLAWELLTWATEQAEAVCRAHGLELRTTVTTNGLLLDEDRSSWLAAHGFVVGLSCDGTAAAHDPNRIDLDGAPTHGRVVRALEAARRARLRLRVIVVVSPATVALLGGSLDELRARGAEEFVVSPNWAAPWDAEWGDGTGLERWRRGYESATERYLEAYRADRPFALSFLDAKIGAGVRGGTTAAERCDLGRQNLVVAPSGNLYPCDRLVGEDRDHRFVIGHVTTGPDLAAVAAVVRAAGAQPADCAACAIASRCQNRCACANVAERGALDVPSAWLCFHERLAVELGDRVAETLYGEKNRSFMRRFYGT